MTGFRVDNFGGVTPRLGSRLLPTNGAQTAQNVKIFSGELRSWLKATAITTSTKAGTLKSMYRMYSTSSADYWLTWADDVDVVKGLIAGDTSFKLYYTGDSTGIGGPKKTNFSLATVGGTDYPHDYLELGVPAPGSAPVVVGTGGTATTSITRVYAYTYVTGTDLQGTYWGEEGPPSPLGTGTGKSDATWVISALSTGTAGKYALTAAGGAIKRIYRTLTDSAGNTNYQLALDSVPIATTSTSDAVADANLGIIAPTFTNGIVNSEWVGPPSDMKGILALPNGILAGFSKNLICFSEPFYPHAWPIRYRLATNFDIVGIGAFGQTLIVVTKGFPYAVVGARPDSMVMSRIDEIHPCSNKRSVVSFPFGVAWATPDGLALAGVGGALNAIEPYMKRDEWRAQCFPDTIIAANYLNAYFGFFNNGSTGLNFVFDRANTQGPLTFGNFSVDGVWHDPETSKMYLLQSGVVKQWDADSLNNSPFDWKSKTFVLPNPVNMGAIQVDADYNSLNDTNAILAQQTADGVVNASIIGTTTSTSTNVDTKNLTAWAVTTLYGTSTGSGIPASVVKSSSGVHMAVCIQAGTSSNVEPTWPSTMGGTATDGQVKWLKIWDLQGVSKGDLRGHILQGHIQYNTGDPSTDGPAGNQWGFPLRGSLLVGGTYAAYDTRYLTLKVFAITTYSTSSGPDTTCISTSSLTNRTPVRLPKGTKSDTWEFELIGNISTRYFKVAQTMDELGRI